MQQTQGIVYMISRHMATVTPWRLHNQPRDLNEPGQSVLYPFLLEPFHWKRVEP